ncbi:hypothetical protein [Bacillus subtilis]|uniref:hypothetical protein n=1 Tax=Bacillus subtilis TaxID=1423 RepID=UPI0034E22B54
MDDISNAFSKLTNEQLKTLVHNWLRWGLYYVRNLTQPGGSVKKKDLKQVQETCNLISDGIHNFPDHLVNFDRDSAIFDLGEFVLNIDYIVKNMTYIHCFNDTLGIIIKDIHKFNDKMPFFLKDLHEKWMKKRAA